MTDAARRGVRMGRHGGVRRVAARPAAGAAPSRVVPLEAAATLVRAADPGSRVRVAGRGTRAGVVHVPRSLVRGARARRPTVAARGGVRRTDAARTASAEGPDADPGTRAAGVGPAARAALAPQTSGALPLSRMR